MLLFGIIISTFEEHKVWLDEKKIKQRINKYSLELTCTYYRNKKQNELKEDQSVLNLVLAIIRDPTY